MLKMASVAELPRALSLARAGRYASVFRADAKIVGLVVTPLTE
jgi:hypothetical protein